MSARKLTAAAAAAVLAVAGLAGCRSNVGAAAVVDGHRISESDVHSYLDPAGPSAATVAQAAQNGQTIVPKSVVLNTLVQERVFGDALTRTQGGLPSPSTLAANHDQAASALTGQSITGAQLDAQIARNLAAEGVRAGLQTVVQRVIDLEYALVVRLNPKSQADFAAAIAQHHISVSVNGAYGAWSPADLGVLNGSSKTAPDFLTLQSGAPSGATSAG